MIAGFGAVVRSWGGPEEQALGSDAPRTARDLLEAPRRSMRAETMLLQRVRRLSSLLLVAVVAAGCDKKDDLRDEQGAAPPPIASSRPGLCAGGGGKVTDSVSAGYFPRSVGDYCIDPNAEIRAYGENAPGTVDKVCTELFD